VALQIQRAAEATAAANDPRLAAAQNALLHTPAV